MNYIHKLIISGKTYIHIKKTSPIMRMKSWLYTIAIKLFYVGNMTKKFPSQKPSVCHKPIYIFHD